MLHDVMEWKVTLRQPWPGHSAGWGEWEGTTVIHASKRFGPGLKTLPLRQVHLLLIWWVSKKQPWMASYSLWSHPLALKPGSITLSPSPCGHHQDP